MKTSLAKQRSAKPNAAARKIIAQINQTQKSAETAKKLVKAAKAEFKAAKKKWKEAKRAAKSHRKDLKELKAELVALAKKRSGMPIRPARKKRATPAAHGEVPAAAPVVSSVPEGEAPSSEGTPSVAQ